MDTLRLAGDIRRKALALGFDRVGFCTADLPQEAAHFEAWLQRGLHAEMAWIARGRDRRLDPQKVLAGARSFVVAALAYAAPDLPHDPAGEEASPAGPGPFVARYARGEDYHQVMGDRLAVLEDFIEAQAPGHRALAYVDTGPILERLWAARAGIGWIGKNGLVLNREMGSFFLLGLVITTLPLPPDRPATDACGHCTLCLDSCPTGAILPGRLVDSGRCLSYLTIEKRGALAIADREAIGARLFGCDDCQEVCPWNRQAGGAAARRAGEPGCEGRDLLGRRALPSLAALLALTPEAYQETLRGSAMKRATFTGLRRNAALALGHVAAAMPEGAARDDAIAALRRAAEQETDETVREQAAWSLRRLAASGRQAQPQPPGRPQPPPPDPDGSRDDFVPEDEPPPA